MEPPDASPSRTRERQDAFLALFARTGIATTAILESGLPYTQHYRWLKEDPGYARRFAELKEQTRGLAAANRKPRPSGPGAGRAPDLEKRAQRQEAVLAALAKTGVIMDAARAAGIYPAQVHEWRRNDSAFAGRMEVVLREVQDIRRSVVAERLGRASKERWNDPERRQAWSEFQRTSWTPEKRAAQARRSRERMEDPDYRAAWEEANRAVRGSPEARLRNSERMQKLWSDPAYVEKHRIANTRPERLARLSEAATEQWAALTPEERSGRLRKMRRAFKGGHKLTRIESDVMLALNDREVPYLAHKQIDDYVADIYVPALKLIIECDGAWHHDKRRDSDEKRDAVLLALGYRTLRLSEAEIKMRDWSGLDRELASGQ